MVATTLAVEYSVPCRVACFALPCGAAFPLFSLRIETLMNFETQYFKRRRGYIPVAILSYLPAKYSAFRVPAGLPSAPPRSGGNIVEIPEAMRSQLRWWQGIASGPPAKLFK